MPPARRVLPAFVTKPTAGGKSTTGSRGTRPR